MASLNKARAQKLWLYGALILVLAFLTKEVTTAQSFIVTGDLWFENFLVGIRTPLLLHIFELITYLGNGAVVAAITVIAGLFLWVSKAPRSYIAGLVVSVGGSYGADYVMKALIERARPGDLIPSTIESFFSFPSGHATAAVALYGFLACIFLRLYPKRAAAAILAAAAIILAVGFSRLYLGVHYPSDVIAGFILGALWVLIGIEIAEWRRPARNRG